MKVEGIEKTLKGIKIDFNNSVLSRTKKIINTTLEALKDATPVDTGHARDSWTSTKNSIKNEVEYISILNRGTSKQAPTHFIEKTVLAQQGISPSGIIVKNI